MSFADPIWLLGLLLLPLLVLAYLGARRRRRAYAIRFPAAASLAAAGVVVPAWRRHLPGALALLAVLALVVAVAKPQRDIRVPIEQASIVLVTDHSGSMQATDVEPNRLRAVQKAANRFIDEVPDEVKIGAVGFSDAPTDVQAPTTDHAAARQTIDRQEASGATATGDALAAAIRLVRPGAGRPPAAIVLLSDGATTTGSDPLEAAQQARRLGVPVYTVALGSPGATVPNPNPLGPPLSAAPDPQTLRQIAQISGGRAFTAEDAGSLTSIYERLGSQLATRKQEREITTTFAWVGLALLLGAVGFGVASRGRLT